MLVAVATFLSVVGVAGAHAGGSKDYLSVFKGVEPDDLPVKVTIKDRDDRIRIENLGTETLIIEGYDDDAFDPYVRIEPGQAFVNRMNRAYYENKGRYGAPVPEAVKRGGAPKWQSAGRVPFYTFHDHRIHWMARTPPGSVDTKKGGRQKVYDWEITVRYGDEPGAIKGTLYYTGGKSARRTWIVWAVTALALLALLSAVLIERRRRRSRKVE